jgi:spore germination cell wall hydrolase CwlJ-like protein
LKPELDRFLFYWAIGISSFICIFVNRFDPVRAGFYCEACFEARHPAYRMNHSWILLDVNATAINQEKEWITHLATHQLEQDQAELKLLLNETQTFLHENTNLTEKTRRLLPGSQKNNFDFAKAFESIQLIDTTLKELIKQVHVQLSTKPLTKLDAIKKIQSMWKIRQARKQLKLLIRSIYTEFKDPATGKIFYFNKQTKTSQWTKPKALGQEPILKPQSTTTKLNKNKKLLLMIEDKPRQQQMAAQMIQGMFRIFIARKHLHHIAFKVYEKIWDPISQRFYYHNTKTKQVTWVCPVFLMDDNTYNIKKNKTPLTKEEAAIILQRMFRKRNSFLVLLRMCRLVYERIYDPEQKTFYYHNTRTHETSWEKPKILKQEEVFTPRTRRRQIAEQQKQQQVVIEKKKKEWTPEQAAICLQGIFRLRKAKNVLADKILQVYRKVHDPLTGQFYYYNTKTGGVSWECSSFVAQTKVDIEVYPST